MAREQMCAFVGSPHLQNIGIFASSMLNLTPRRIQIIRRVALCVNTAHTHPPPKCNTEYSRVQCCRFHEPTSVGHRECAAPGGHHHWI